MNEDEFQSALLRALNQRWAHSASVQFLGASVFAEFAREAGRYLGYPIYYISRPQKSRSRLQQKALSVREILRTDKIDLIISQLKDFAGGRILVLGLDDIDATHKSLSR